MPYAVLENAYSKLDEFEQKEAIDFILYLVSRKQKKQDEKKEIDFSFVDNLFGTISDEEADEMRENCHLHLKENL